MQFMTQKIMMTTTVASSSASASYMDVLQALQVQLHALQQENSTLTKELCLKEKYLQLKEHQLRMMQQRMEELETSCASWQHKCTMATQQTPSQDANEWKVWELNTTQLMETTIDALSAAERAQIKEFMAHDGSMAYEMSFQDVSEHLQRMLAHCITQKEHSQVECLVRTYAKPAVDLKIVCRAPESISTDVVEAVASVNQEPLDDASSTEQAQEHLFDCVDCENPKRPGVPHGPRELHATKAVYVSKPLVTPSPTSMRRISRHSNSTDSSKPITVEIEDELMPPAPGKIKKIMGSVMSGMRRNKPTKTPPKRLSMKDDDSVCDACGRGPIVGCKWVCRTCRLSDDPHDYELCEKCYGQGMHGKENEDALFERIEAIVITKCPKLATEVPLIRLLRVGICKANLKKFSFCLTWIADLLQCKQTKELRARALEISQISPQVRSEFVKLLTELLQTHRRDIELITEWEPVTCTPSVGTDDAMELDTLRIWVKDIQESGNGN